jgi:mono/diheme cytochrome c family protein
MTMRRTLHIGIPIVIIAVLLVLFSSPGCERKPASDNSPGDKEEIFQSNGEQIYFTGTSKAGRSIAATGGTMMHGRYRFCADCHGEDGKGREVRMMMHSFRAPDIRYDVLTSGHHHEGETEHEDEHPPYTDETIKRAVTKGVNPSGTPLDSLMPRWSMSDEDLEDLLEYLKTLK